MVVKQADWMVSWVEEDDLRVWVGILELNEVAELNKVLRVVVGVTLCLWKKNKRGEVQEGPRTEPWGTPCRHWENHHHRLYGQSERFSKVKSKCLSHLLVMGCSIGHKPLLNYFRLDLS